MSEPKINEGMAAFAQKHRVTDQVKTWREMNPFGTPLWEVRGHTLEYEQTCGLPAIRWETSQLYEGDDEEEATKVVWQVLAHPETVELTKPYVLFLYRMGDLRRRIDIVG